MCRRGVWKIWQCSVFAGKVSRSWGIMAGYICRTEEGSILWLPVCAGRVQTVGWWAGLVQGVFWWIGWWEVCAGEEHEGRPRVQGRSMKGGRMFCLCIVNFRLWTTLSSIGRWMSWPKYVTVSYPEFNGLPTSLNPKGMKQKESKNKKQTRR